MNSVRSKGLYSLRKLTRSPPCRSHFNRKFSATPIMSHNPEPYGVLLVGSVPFATSKEVFTKASKALPRRLYTIPDGETGDRFNYVDWQGSRFPAVCRQMGRGGEPIPEAGVPEYTIDDIKPTLYDESALASYAEFVELRKQGLIASDVRFQVCLPTPFNVLMSHCKAEVKAQIEPLYQERFEASLRNILDNIPHDDMVIQWDLAFDIICQEYELGRLKNERFAPWFSPVKEGVLARLFDICRLLPSDVKIGFHLCHGDAGHKHFIEPTDAGLTVDFANDIMDGLREKHFIEYIHMPVPKNRTDDAYFEPLRRLRLDGTRLYLGLVHANDEEGTRERIRVAQSICPFPFGVATECGMGRTPKSEIDSIFAISEAVTTPAPLIKN